MAIHKKHLQDNYSDLIISILNDITDTNFELVFVLEDELEDDKRLFQQILLIIIFLQVFL